LMGGIDAIVNFAAETHVDSCLDAGGSCARRSSERGCWPRQPA
jgi:hypothetical protein